MKKLLALVFASAAAFASAQTTTPNLQMTLPNFGAANWNIPLNNDLSILDKAIGILQVPDFGTWSSTTVYPRGAQVLFMGAIYTSLINSNFNNTPNLAPSAWQFNQAASNFCSLSGCTLTGQLNGTSAVFSGNVTAASFSFGSEAANLFLAGPCTGSSTVPVFRAICLSDLPTGIPNANLANPSVTLNGQSLALGGSLTLPFSTGGTDNISIDGINFVPSSANSTGLVATPSNPSGNSEKWEISGAYASPIPASQITGSSMTINGQTLNLGGSATIPFFTDDTINISTGGINFVPSSANATGLTVTPSNPAGDQEQYEIGGTYTLPIPYSQITGAPTLPSTIAEVGHEWLNSYNASTGVFGQSQPTFADISGVAAASQIPFPSTGSIGGVESVSPVANEFVTGISTAGVPSLGTVAYSGLTGLPTLAQTIAPVTNEWLTGYTASTGIFTQSQPAFSNLSGSATAAQTPTACQLTGCNLTGALGINTTSQFPIEAFNSAMTTGGANALIVGQSLTTNNSGGIQFNDVGGSGSSSNTITISVVNGSPITVSSAGGLNVPSTLTAASTTINGTFEVNTPAVVNSQFLNTALTTGGLNAIEIGLANATNNSAGIIFNNVGGSGSSANTMSLGLNNAAQLVIGTTGSLLVPSSLAVGANAVVNGSGNGMFTVSDAATGSQAPVFFSQPNLSTGSVSTLAVGTSLSANNGVDVTFENVGGAGSASNLMALNLIGGASVTIGSLGQMLIPSTLSVASGEFTVNSVGNLTINNASGGNFTAITSASSNNAPFQIAAASLATGATTGMAGGLALSTSSDFDLLFQNNGGLGSSSNLMQLGLVNDPQVTIGTSGQMVIPGSLSAAGGTFSLSSSGALIMSSSAGSSTFPIQVIDSHVPTSDAIGILVGLDTANNADFANLSFVNVGGAGSAGNELTLSVGFNAPVIIDTNGGLTVPGDATIADGLGVGANFSVGTSGNLVANQGHFNSFITTTDLISVVPTTSSTVAMLTLDDSASSGTGGTSWSVLANAIGGFEVVDNKSGAAVPIPINISGTGEVLMAGGVAANSYEQGSTGATSGTCTMTTSTCSFTITATYSNPLCFVSQMSGTVTAGQNVSCGVSGHTVTLTAAVSNSVPWGAFVIGNPN